MSFGPVKPTIDINISPALSGELSQLSEEIREMPDLYEVLRTMPWERLSGIRIRLSEYLESVLDAETQSRNLVDYVNDRLASGDRLEGELLTYLLLANAKSLIQTIDGLIVSSNPILKSLAA